MVGIQQSESSVRPLVGRKRRLDHVQQINYNHHQQYQQQIQNLDEQYQRYHQYQNHQNQEQQEHQHNQDNIRNGYTRTIEDLETELKENLKLVINKHPNTKVSQALRTLLENITQKKIVEALMEISERPEFCIDFDIPLKELLEMYILHGDDPVLSEAGYMILSATQIYARRVDNVKQSFELIASGIPEDLKALNENPNNSTTQRPNRRVPKRQLKANDHLYEAEMVPKQIKLATDTKITETITDLCLLDPPKHFFKKWKEYKEWREMQKKRMKGLDVSHSLACHDQYIHPSLWKDSCIEDFDYEDDIETKRSFRIFTDHIEHRHNTLVKDVNFLLHFKVKDFIEAEQDKIDEMNSLGLPLPPKRVWPPFCRIGHNDNSDIQLNCDNENEKDYLKNYMELEDEVLEKESWFEKEQHDEPSRKRIRIDIPMDVNNEDDDNDNHNETLPLNEQNSNVINSSSNNTDSAINDSTMCNSNNLESVNNSSILRDENSQTVITEKSANDQSSSNPLDILQTSEMIMERTNTERIDRNKILCKLHANDEGTLFGDLDEIDRAMLLPVVELVDIFKPLSENLRNQPDLIQHIQLYSTPPPSPPSSSSPLPASTLEQQEQQSSNSVSHQIQNLLGIDLSHLQYEEDFQLPSEFQRSQLRMNLLKIPDYHLCNSKLFQLPSDYEIWKKDRFKSIGRDATERNPRIFKLNNVDIENVTITPPQSPTTDPELFLGFTEDELSYFPDLAGYIENLENGKKSKTLNTHQSRMDSRDSGVGLMNLESNDDDDYGDGDLIKLKDLQQAIEINKNEMDNNLTLEDNIDLNGVPNLNSTKNNDNIYDLLKLKTDETAIVEQSTTFFDSGIQSGTDLNSTILQSSNEISIEKSNNIIQENSSTNSEDNSDLDKEETSYVNEDIQNWHRALKPVLAYTHKRRHFDVKELGTEILDKFSSFEKEKGDTITLEDVMKGKDPCDISRYFFTTLMLANHGNINITAINQSDKRPTQLNELSLKLVNRRRLSVSLEDNIGMPNTDSRNSIPSTSLSLSSSSSSSAAAAATTKSVPSSSTPLAHSNGFVASSTPSASIQAFNRNKKTALKKTNTIATAATKTKSKDSSTKVLNSLIAEKVSIAAISTPGPSGINFKSNNTQQINGNGNSQSANIYTDDDGDSSSSSSNDENGLSLAVLTKRKKLNMPSVTSSTLNLSGISIKELSNELITTELSINDESNNIVNYVENYIDNDGFIYPKKSKNFFSLSNKKRLHSDDTDSGFHSQISSSSQRSIP